MIVADRTRALIYVQHLLGIGHLRRAMAISRACVEAGMAVDLVSGGMPVSHPDPGGARLVQLPPAQASTAGDWSLVDANGTPVDDAWRTRRRKALLDAFAEARPHVLVVELFPFGRRQMDFELLPLLEAAAAANPRPRVLCSVRDILQTGRRPERTAEAASLIEEHFDAVLVHGDPAVVDFEASFPAARRIKDKLHYTGYVSSGIPAAPDAADSGVGEVLVSAGGGAAGATLLRIALAARARSRLPGTVVWRLLVGDNLPRRDLALIETEAARADGIIMEPARTDFPAMLARCALSVSQGGYNTVTDILAAGCRAVIVPYASNGETEQTLRAERLAALGRVHVLPEAVLSPDSLAACVEVTAGMTLPELAIDLSGAERTARLIAACLRQETPE